MSDLVSRRAQVARIRRTAVRALADYPVDEPWLSFIAHGENTTSGRLAGRGRIGGGTGKTCFGDTMEYGGVSAAGYWDLLPAPVRTRFEESA